MRKFVTVVKHIAMFAVGIMSFGANAGTQLYPTSGTASYGGSSDFTSERFAVSGVDADAGGYARYTYSANATADARLQGFKCYDSSNVEIGGNWDLIYKGVQKDYDRVIFLNPGTAKITIRWLSSVTATNIKVESANLDDALAYADSVWAEVNDGDVLATVLQDYPLPADPFALLPKTKAALINGTEQPFKIHMLGDSITQDSYYSLIQALLKRQFPKSNLKFTLKTSSGRGCWYYSENGLFDSAVKAYVPDLLIICGVDNFRGAADNRYVAGLEDVIDKTKAQLPDCEILYITPAHASDSRCADLLSCNEWGTPCASSKFELPPEKSSWDIWSKDCYNPIVRNAVLTAKSVPCWDVYPQCYDYQNRSGRPLGWFNRDTLHNNERGKAMIARVMLEYFKAAANGEGGEDPLSAVMEAVTVTVTVGSDPVAVALTANTQKLREFLAANKVEAYMAAKPTAKAISAALEDVPTGDRVNGLPLWKDYALGISPTDSVRAVADAAKDTDPNAITLSIPTIVNGNGSSGDFTIKYQVIDRARSDLKSESENADAIKIPLATGIYDIKIFFEPRIAP